MNESVDCMVCIQPGKLRMDYHPPVIEHRVEGRRSKFCHLPPRDVKVAPVQRPTWLEAAS